MVVYLRMGWHLHLRMRVEVLSGVLGLVLGVCVCVRCCIAHNLGCSPNFPKNRSHVVSVCFSQ